MKALAAELKRKIKAYDTVLIGIGSEWKAEAHKDLAAVYNILYEEIKYKNFFVVTTVTDALIYKSKFGIMEGFFAPVKQIVAPCGNETWQQCIKSCTKDIWEPDEIADGLCPHCGASLTGNTVSAPDYIEEGYLPQWNRYLEWLSATIKHPVLILELGVGFSHPTVIRFPFEKTTVFNQQAELIRINRRFPQLPKELGGRGTSIAADSVEIIRFLPG